MLQYADVILPAGTFAETAGTFVNAEGLWQDFSAAGKPVGDSRPGWKILRVLGNELGLIGFDYFAAPEVRRELKEACRSLSLDNSVPAAAIEATPARDGLIRVGDVPIYSVDPLVRRSRPLQEAADAGRPVARRPGRSPRPGGWSAPTPGSGAGPRRTFRAAGSGRRGSGRAPGARPTGPGP